MIHPWIDRRISRNFTQEQIASALNVNRQTVIRLEQGLFHVPSENVLSELSVLYDCTIGELIEEYSEFVKATREEFRGSHKSFQEFFKETGDYLPHPVAYYMQYYELSTLGLCRAMCLDYGPVSDYVKNRQRGVPATIKAACSDMKWDYAPLESAVSEWRIRCR